jgi:exosortase A-associated hydrolase 2
MKPEAFFLAAEMGNNRQRFCLLHPSQTPDVRGLVLYIHPFAEEMNKSRRMAALQARAMARAGYAVLQIDLLGCGDSAGDFGDATWQHWVHDVTQGCQWLRQRYDTKVTGRAPVPLWLWGLRAGCLLAVEAARQLDEACHFLFWQAPASGQVLLQQFLRLKVANDMLSRNTSNAMADMRRDLASGAALEIAGYMLSPALANGLEQASLAPPVSVKPTQRLLWLEVSPLEDSSLSPASSQTIAAWRQAGFETTSQRVRGPAFWLASEIEEAPALMAASIQAMTAESAAPLPELVSA